MKVGKGGGEWGGGFPFPFILCRKQLKLQPCFRLSTDILFFSDTKEAFLLFYTRTEIIVFMNGGRIIIQRTAL